MMDKARIARIFDEIAVFLELQGENPFKVRAYQNAARTLDALEESVRDLVARGEIDQVPGLGRALAEKVTALVETGELKFYDDLKTSIPPGLIEMLEVPGLGPKKIKTIH